MANLRMKSNTESGGGKLSGTLRVQQEENSESVKFELQKEVLIGSYMWSSFE